MSELSKYNCISQTQKLKVTSFPGPITGKGKLHNLYIGMIHTPKELMHELSITSGESTAV